MANGLGGFGYQLAALLRFGTIDSPAAIAFVGDAYVSGLGAKGSRVPRVIGRFSQFYAGYLI